MRPLQKTANHLGDVMSLRRKERYGTYSQDSLRWDAQFKEHDKQFNDHVNDDLLSSSPDALDHHNGSHKNGHDMNETRRWSS